MDSQQGNIKPVDFFKISWTQNGDTLSICVSPDDCPNFYQVVPEIVEGFHKLKSGGYSQDDIKMLQDKLKELLVNG